MSKHITRVTVSILKMLKRLEMSRKVLEQSGVTVLSLEQAQMDGINLIMELNKVHRNDDAVDWLSTPIFEFLDNDITRAECIRILHERFREHRQGTSEQGTG